MDPNYDRVLAFISLSIAVLASFAALDLSNGVYRSRGIGRISWLVAASVMMGLAISSMHLERLLASGRLGIHFLFISVAAPALAFYLASRERVRSASILVASLTMGGAIVAIQYSMMESSPSELRWKWFGFSVLIACGLSFFAFFLSCRHRDNSWFCNIMRFGAGFLLGAAIVGTHYAGALAAQFRPVKFQSITGSVILFAVAITLMLGFSLFASLVERALSRRTAMAEKNRALYLRAEESLRALEQERELRERFISSLTHDLRTPLTAAKINAQLLSRQVSEPERAKVLGSRVVQSLDRADRMIRDLLDAHRISANKKLPLSLEAADLAELAKKCLEEAALVFGPRFLFRGEAENVHGYWDVAYLRRLLENLLSNAAKYGRPGSQITLSILPCGRSEVKLLVHNLGEPMKNVKDAFQLFHRMENARDTPGWGIGLTLVKGVAESHGGFVSVESSREAGTTFCITLPLDARAENLASSA